MRTAPYSNYNKPYKVFQVITRLNIGGPAVYTTLLTNYFSNSEFSSVLICGSLGEDEGDMSAYALRYGVKPYYVPEIGREPNIINDLHAFVSLYRIFKNKQPAIVHTHTSKAGVLGRLAAWLAGVPVVVHTFHGHVFNGYFSRPKTALFIFIERLLSRCSDAILTLSPEQHRDILNFGIGGPEKTRMTPLGIDLEPFQHHKPVCLRDELKIAEARLVGIVGRLTLIKNHEMFFAAAKNILENILEPVKFVVVGDGELRVELEEIVNRLGISEHVIFLGWRKDMPNIYRNLDLLLLTSNNEGTPVTIIEAMASGCPVVATRVGGVVDMINHEVNGLLVDPGDALDAARQVVRVLNDPKLAERLASNGREFAFQTFGINRLKDEIGALYRSLLRKKKKCIP